MRKDEQQLQQRTFTPEAGTLLVEDDALQYGFVQLPRQILLARDLSRDAKLLYAVLLHHAWQKERCFPGYAVLCHELQASENSVRKFMRELEAVGLLSQKRRGLGLTNVYTLLRLRTSKIEVLEPQKPQGLEPAKTAVHQIEPGEVEKDHHQPPTPVPVSTTIPQDDDDLLTLLTDRGVGKTQARRLVDAHRPTIREKVAEYDWRLKHQPQTAKRPGFLVASIQHSDDYPTPDEYLKAQTREATRRRHAEEEATADRAKLLDEARIHASDPEQRARNVITIREQAGQKVFRKPPTPPEQLEQQITALTERYREDAEAFFALHRDLVSMVGYVPATEHNGHVPDAGHPPNGRLSHGP